MIPGKTAAERKLKTALLALPILLLSCALSGAHLPITISSMDCGEEPAPRPDGVVGVPEGGTPGACALFRKRLLAHGRAEVPLREALDQIEHQEQPLRRILRLPQFPAWMKARLQKQLDELDARKADLKCLVLKHIQAEERLFEAQWRYGCVAPPRREGPGADQYTPYWIGSAN